MEKRKLKTIIFILSIILFSNISYSQKKACIGKIYDGNTKEPIHYANVYLKNLSAGVYSEENGDFKLQLEKGAYELQVSYIGYRTELVKVNIENSDVYLTIPLIKTDVLLQEVSVYAKSSDTAVSNSVSSISMQSKRVEQISGVFPDVFRSIQMLPGISVNNEYSAKFNVRGGNYDENLVVVNGTQIYEPFHLKEAANASVGIFNINLMNNVDIMTGGFSAMYGDRLSSVLKIEYREGNREKLSGAATLSLTNLEGYIEGPVSSNSTFLLGLRKSYLEYAMSLLDVEKSVRPTFYDVQGIFTHRFSTENKLQFKFIRSGDDFTKNDGLVIYTPTKGTGTFYGEPAKYYSEGNDFGESNGNYYNNLFDLQYTSVIGGKAILKTALSYYEQSDKEHSLDTSYSRTDVETTKNYSYTSTTADVYENSLNIKTVEGKISFEYQLTPYYEIRTGGSYQNLKYDQDLTNYWRRLYTQNYDTYPVYKTDIYSDQPLDYSGEKISASSHKAAGYVENVFQFNGSMLVNLGGRVDYFGLNKDFTFSPRISTSYKLGPVTTLRGAWGFFYQSPIYRQLLYSFSSDTNTQSQKATHYIAGIEHLFTFGRDDNSSLSLKIEGYYKKYDDLISSSADSYGRITYSRKNDSKGYAAGFDLYTVLNLPGFYGWISYGYLKSNEEYISGDPMSNPRYTDQTHTISLVADFDLGKNWGLNFRTAYGSGFAYTPRYPSYNSTTQLWSWTMGTKNSGRLPEYKRVDLRVNKELFLWGASANLFLDVSNLLNFENIQGYSYRFDGRRVPYKEKIKLWTIIPSIGLTVKF